MAVEDSKFQNQMSRYIGVMGMAAVKKQARAKVIQFGLGALGVEIAKNVILSGVNQYSLVDFGTKVTQQNICGQFFLTHSDLGQNRAEATFYKLSELNYYVKVDIKNIERAQTLSLDGLKGLHQSLLDGYDVFVLTECSMAQILAFSHYCRVYNKKLIVADCYGACCRVLTDFGDSFEVAEKGIGDIKKKTHFIEKIEHSGVVRFHDGMKHEFDTGDWVVIDDVIERVPDIFEQETLGSENCQAKSGINKQIVQIRRLSDSSVQILDYSTITGNVYVRNGTMVIHELPERLKFEPLHEILESKLSGVDPGLEIIDFKKLDAAQYLNHSFNCLWEFLDSNKHQLPEAHNSHLAEEIFLAYENK
jgi:molybdopterin/thiamine biosynthesis adenylyltransferase